MYQPPAGLRGRRPSHRNNAKHGLSALPHPFRATAPNQIKLSKSQIEKFYSIFFKKSQGSRGQRPRSPAAAGEIPARRNGRNSRAAHGAKLPLAAASETPARRSGRNPQASQSAIRRWRNPRGNAARPPSPPPRGWRTAAFSRPPSSGGGKPPPYGVEPIGTPGIDGVYQRRDTQVPPYDDTSKPCLCPPMFFPSPP